MVSGLENGIQRSVASGKKSKGNGFMKALLIGIAATLIMLVSFFGFIIVMNASAKLVVRKAKESKYIYMALEKVNTDSRSIEVLGSPIETTGEKDRFGMPITVIVDHDKITVPVGGSRKTGFLVLVAPFEADGPLKIKKLDVIARSDDGEKIIQLIP